MSLTISPGVLGPNHLLQSFMRSAKTEEAQRADNIQVAAVKATDPQTQIQSEALAKRQITLSLLSVISLQTR
ncbi:hypothetical protein [Asticcacaulis sp. W401b]|uniref:hypothetical protein n=1 Tax=Asticcacaulis sp. W401b TaxID=3388666 RepID=UPI00397090D7